MWTSEKYLTQIIRSKIGVKYFQHSASTLSTVFNTFQSYFTKRGGERKKSKSSVFSRKKRLKYSYHFTVGTAGERQGLWAGMLLLLLQRFFLRDKSRTPSIKKQTHIYYLRSFQTLSPVNLLTFTDLQLPWFFMVRSKGASWSDMRSLLRTGFWFCAGPARISAKLVEVATNGRTGAGRVWSEWSGKCERPSRGRGELVFEVYSAANWLIILWRISRATTGMCGSDKRGTSETQE